MRRLVTFIGSAVLVGMALSEDPHEVPKIELEWIDVPMVFVGGGLEVCAPSVSALCP